MIITSLQRDYTKMDIIELRMELQAADERVFGLLEQQELTSVYHDIERLQEELKTARERVHLLEDEVELLRADVDSYRAREARAISDKNKAEGELGTVEEKLNAACEKEERTEKRLSVVDLEAASFRKNLDDKATRLRIVENNLEYSALELKAATESKEAIEAKFEEVSARLAITKNELQQMTSEKERADARCVSHASLTREYSRLKKQLEQEENLRDIQKQSSSSNIAVERARYEALLARYKDQSVVFNDVKEISDLTKAENDKLKTELAKSQKLASQMVQQADHGLRALKNQKVLKEQVKLLTEKIAYLEADRLKLKKDLVKKQRAVGGAHDERMVTEVKRLREENHALKEAAKHSTPSFLRKEVEELKVTNEVLKEMVRSANINARVVLAKHRKGTRSPVESTLHNTTVAVTNHRASPKPGTSPTSSPYKVSNTTPCEVPFQFDRHDTLNEAFHDVGDILQGGHMARDNVYDSLVAAEPEPQPTNDTVALEKPVEEGQHPPEGPVQEASTSERSLPSENIQDPVTPESAVVHEGANVETDTEHEAPPEASDSDDGSATSYNTSVSAESQHAERQSSRPLKAMTPVKPSELPTETVTRYAADR